jgi:vitamin B12 transporter
MNNKIVRISALCVLMSACAFAQQRNNFYSNELNEVVISDSKFAFKRKVGKVIVKLRLRVRNQVNLLLLF